MGFTMPDIYMIIGNVFGLLLALPISLFLAFWLSAVRMKAAVVIGAFIGVLIAFAIIFIWAGSVPGANGGSIFFGSTLFCTIIGLMSGIMTDLLIARINTRDYRRQAAH